MRPPHRLLGAVLTALTLTAVLLSAAGCGDGTAPTSADGPRRLHQRLIPEAPQEPFRGASLVELQEVEGWDFARDSAWRSDGADLEDRRLTGGRFLRSSRQFQTLSREVDLDAAEVDTFELLLGRTKGASFSLAWHGPGEGFDHRRRLRVAADDIARSSLSRVLFDLRHHPLWRGRIAALQLAIGAPAEQRIQLRRLRGSRGTIDGGRLAATLARPWIVELGRDARSALLLVPGVDLRRSLTLPPAARLRTAWGLPESYPPASRVQVVWQTDGRSPKVLYDRAVGAEDRGRWHDLEVDLEPWAGDAGELTFRLIGPPPDGTSPGAWANPEITARVAPSPNPTPRPPDVLLLSLDTLRADRLSAYGYELPTSPRIDAWAARHGVLFEQAIASAPWTLPSHVSLFTGLDAHRHGINHDAPLPPDLTTLAEHLRRAGYRTRAVTGGSFLLPAYGTAQGFDRFVHHPSRNAEEKAAELERGLGVALEMLREAPDEPLFLFFHTYETHAPYRPRQPFFEDLHGYPPPPHAGIPKFLQPRADNGYVDRREPDVPGAPQLSAAQKSRLSSDLYDSGVAYLDDRLGDLFDALGERPGALVVLTSDHGEMLGEHGLAGHSYLYDPNLRVPLIFAAPDGRGAGRRIADQVRSVDLLPTVLDLLDLPPAEGVDGVSLVPFFDGERPPALPNAAWSYAARTNRGLSLRLRNRLKVVLDNSVWQPVAGQVRAFDLRRDPAEANPEVPPEGALERLRDTFDALPGLWIELDNRSDEVLRGEVEGPLVSPPSLKSSRLDGSRWSFLGRDLAAFEVPPGSRTRVRAEVVPAGPLTLRARLGDAPPWQVRLRRDALEEKHRWIAGEDGWREVPAAGTEARASARLELTWVGPQRGADRAVSSQDEDLRQQLRALGYID